MFWCLHFNGNHIEEKQLTTTILFLLKQLLRKFLKFFWNTCPASSASTLLQYKITTAENHLGLQLYETLARVFSRECCEICQKTFSHRTSLADASYYCFSLLAHLVLRGRLKWPSFNKVSLISKFKHLTLALMALAVICVFFFTNSNMSSVSAFTFTMHVGWTWGNWKLSGNRAIKNRYSFPMAIFEIKRNK